MAPTHSYPSVLIKYLAPTSIYSPTNKVQAQQSCPVDGTIVKTKRISHLVCSTLEVCSPDPKRFCAKQRKWCFVYIGDFSSIRRMIYAFSTSGIFQRNLSSTVCSLALLQDSVTGGVFTIQGILPDHTIHASFEYSSD